MLSARRVTYAQTTHMEYAQIAETPCVQRARNFVRPVITNPLPATVRMTVSVPSARSASGAQAI